MNTINLMFDKSETRLAGFPYGEAVFKSQVEDKINYSEEINIIFPDNIEKIASSFIQGFFSKIIQNIGYTGFEKNVHIHCSSEELKQYIRKNIY